MNSLNTQFEISVNRLRVHTFVLAVLTYLTISPLPRALGVSPSPDGG